MLRHVAVAVLAASTTGWPLWGHAGEPGPDAAKVRQAAESYDAGVRAWHAGSYAAAASHFEAADEAVPSVVSITEAIKSRRKARQGARAATLAASALRRHPAEGQLVALAEEVITELAPQTHRLDVRCSTPCVLAAGKRVIAGPAARSAVLYVEPGQRTIGASFADGAGATQQVVVAVEGGRNTLYLHPPPSSAPAAAPGPRASDPGGESTASGAAAEPGAGQRPDAQERSASSPGRGAGQDGEAAVADDWRLSPVWFFVGVGASVVLGGVTAWSAVDTVNDPGEETVRDNCVGLGPECPEYVEGRKAAPHQRAHRRHRSGRSHHRRGGSGDHRLGRSRRDRRGHEPDEVEPGTG